ncbi:MAG: hypothetical protein JNL01_13855 [Bdellovibrionales bacterium]|nr:hypothetical protein [Bdellovibrionales bacterium]
MGNDNDPITEFESLDDFTKKAAAAGELPPLPGGGEAFMEAKPIESISNFESLDDYTKSHPDEMAKEQPLDLPPPEMALAPPPAPDFAPPSLPADGTLTEVGTDPFAVTPQDPGAPLSGLSGMGDPTGQVPPLDLQAPLPPQTDHTQGFMSLGDTSATADVVALEQERGVAPPHDFSDLSAAQTGIIGHVPLGESGSGILVPPPALPESPDVAHLMTDAAPEPKDDFSIPKVPAAPAPSLDTVRKYSEEARNFSNVTAAANLPFTVLIEGKLEDDERARLVDIVNREKLGVTELDLEPQFAANRVLIPRVSEYAAILIVSALRSMKGRMRISPSEVMDQVMGKKSEKETDAPVPQTSGGVEIHPMLSMVTGAGGKDESIHPAEIIPVTSAEALPGFGAYHVVDAVTATASVRIPHGRIEFSPEYRDLSEKLKVELQFKAYRKGANGIIHFSIQIVPLTDPTVFRLLAAGSAIRSGAEPRIPKALDLPSSSRDTRIAKPRAKEIKATKIFDPPHPENFPNQPTQRAAVDLTQAKIGASSPSWTPAVPDPTDAEFPRPTPLDPSVQSAVDQASLDVYDPMLNTLEGDAALSVAPPSELPQPLPPPPGATLQDDPEASLLLQLSLDEPSKS